MVKILAPVPAGLESSPVSVVVTTARYAEATQPSLVTAWKPTVPIASIPANATTA